MLDKLNFITHYREEEFGRSILVMEETGKCFGRIYFYNDEIDTYYIEGLSVNKCDRNNGYGNLLLKYIEHTCYKLNGKKIFLWCDKYTWMKEWYIRKGYVATKQHETEDNCIWMKKKI